jgi:hypothetical protein
MRDALDELIDAYEALLPSIEQQRPAWALVSDPRSIRTFASFSAAARYARDHYGKKQVLIRHTEERDLESAPFVQVHIEK